MDLHIQPHKKIIASNTLGAIKCLHQPRTHHHCHILKPRLAPNPDLLLLLFPDIHTIALYPPNSIPYFEPTPPPHNKIPQLESNALHILFIHHQSTFLDLSNSLQHLIELSHQLNISILLTQIAKPTLLPITINKTHIWSQLPFFDYTSTNFPPFLTSLLTCHHTKIPSRILLLYRQFLYTTQISQ